MKLSMQKTELLLSVQLQKVIPRSLLLLFKNFHGRLFLRTANSPNMALCCGLALLFGLGMSEANAQNLLINPGFETGDFTGWNQSSPGAFGVYSFPTPVHGGTYQAFIQSSAGSSPNYAFIYQDVAGSAGQTYTASVWARNYAAYPETMQLAMEFHDVNGYYISQAPVQQTINTTYTQLVTSAVAPAGTAKVRIVLLVYSTSGATGVANFDDASITVMTAPNIAYTRPTGVGVQYYSIASLLTNVANVAPGQTITLTSLGGSSQGATVITNVGYIQYTPSNTGTNLDSFTYTVTDGLGGNATGTISVNAISQVQNLLLNPGFETGDLTGWSQSSPGTFGVYSFPTPVHGGTYQAFIQSSAGSSPNYSFVYQEVAGVSNQTYTASVWARDYASYAETMQLAMEFHDVNDTYISQAPVQQTINTSYVQLGTGAVAPAGTAKVRIVLMVYSASGATGVANFDDASISTMTALNTAYVDVGGGSTNISIANVLTNVLGVVPGQTISLTGLGSSSQGATITTNSLYIQYTPSNKSPNIDSFTYTVTDGLGNTATGIISVKVISTPVLKTAPTAGAIYYGQALSNSTLNTASAVVTNVAGATIPGAYTFSAPGTTPGLGTSSQSVTFIPTDTNDYTAITFNVSVTVSQAATSLSVISSENPSGYKDSVNFTATLLPSVATGSIIFLTNGVSYDSEPLSSGSATSVATTLLPRGTDTITVEYATQGNYIGSTNNLSQLVTNHPPVATTMTAYRTAGTTLRVALSDMAANWSDVDGDTVKLMGVNPLTTNLQTLFLLNVSSNLDNSLVISSSSYVGYTNGPNVADQFSYSIADGNGGTNIGLVNIVILTGATGQATGLVNPGGGALMVSFAGLPGYSYSVQRSTNLVTGSGWVTIWTTNAPANGLFNYTDNFSGLGGVPVNAYYRLSWQP